METSHGRMFPMIRTQRTITTAKPREIEYYGDVIRVIIRGDGVEAVAMKGEVKGPMQGRARTVADEG